MKKSLKNVEKPVNGLENSSEFNNSNRNLENDSETKDSKVEVFCNS